MAYLTSVVPRVAVVVLFISLSSAQDPTRDETWKKCYAEFPASTAEIFNTEDISNCTTKGKGFMCCLMTENKLVKDNVINSEETMKYAERWIPREGFELTDRKGYEEAVKNCISNCQADEQCETSAKLWACGIGAWRKHFPQ